MPEEEVERSGSEEQPGAENYAGLSEKNIFADVDFSSLTDEEKAVLQDARYRIMLLGFAKDDPLLEAHILAKIEDIFREKNLTMPQSIKAIVNEEAVRVRQEIEKKLVEKKKEYTEIEQMKKLRRDKQASNKQPTAAIFGKKENDKAVDVEAAKQDSSHDSSHYLDYEEALEFLDDIEKKKGIKLGLDNMAKVLELFGHPEKNYKIIHVAGTNGKGSVCAMVNSILQSASYKAGRYISPHLVKFNERMLINSKQISDEKVAELVNRIKPYLEKVDLTYFEIVTLMALLYFKEEKVDFVVLEVGMGGRLDATNACMPLVAVITNIDLDHMQHLGDTIKDIAYEKSGIIKEGIFVVTGCEGEALDVIKDACQKKNAKLLPLLKHQVTKNGLKISGIDGIRLGLRGEFQHRNAEVAVTAVKALENYGIEIPERCIKIGLADVNWSGRLDFIEDNVLLDCGHNPAGIEVLVKELEKLKKKFEKMIIVFGAMSDKNISEMVLRLTRVADKFFITKADNERAESPENIAMEVGKYRHDFEITNSVREAVEKARAIAGPNELVVVCGSIYVVGEAMEYLEGEGIM